MFEFVRRSHLVLVAPSVHMQEMCFCFAALHCSCSFLGALGCSCRQLLLHVAGCTVHGPGAHWPNMSGWPSGPATHTHSMATLPPPCPQGGESSSSRPPVCLPCLPVLCCAVLCSAATFSMTSLPSETLRDRDVHLHWRHGCPCRGAELSIPCSLTLARLLMDGRININGALLWSGLFCPVRQFTRVNGSIDPVTVAPSSSQQADEGDEASYSKRQRRGCAAQRCPASARTRPAGDGRDRSSRTRLAPKSKLLLAYLAW